MMGAYEKGPSVFLCCRVFSEKEAAERFDSCLAAASKVTGAPTNYILSKFRFQHLAASRHLISLGMLLGTLPDSRCTTLQIGKMLGRDHTTVLVGSMSFIRQAKRKPVIETQIEMFGDEISCPDLLERGRRYMRCRTNGAKDAVKFIVEGE